MSNKYIIINKTAIQKRIEELIKKANTYKKEELEIMYIGCQFQIKVYKEILSQSTPLIPEIEKAIDYGIRKSFGSKKHSEIRQDYISNLKLDI